MAAVAACVRLLELGNIESIDDVEVMVVDTSALMEVWKKEGFERGVNIGGGGNSFVAIGHEDSLWVDKS